MIKIPEIQRAVPSKFGKRDLMGKAHWHTLDINEYRIIQPTIICLGGNGTTDDTPETVVGDHFRSGLQKANAFCKLAESLLGLKMEGKNISSSYRDVEVLGFAYGKDKPTDRVGNFSQSEARRLVDNLLMPLFHDKEGRLLSAEESAKNFSLVTFFTHCHGSREVDRIMSILAAELKDEGYKLNEINYIFDHTMQVSYCPLVESHKIPTVEIKSMVDSINPDLAELYKRTYGKKLNGIDVKGSRFTVTVYTSQMLNTDENSDMRNVMDEHSAFLLGRTNDWKIKTQATNLDVVSQITALALAEKVACSLKNFRDDDGVTEKIDMKAIYDYSKNIIESFDQSELERK